MVIIFYCYYLSAPVIRRVVFAIPAFPCAIYFTFTHSNTIKHLLVVKYVIHENQDEEEPDAVDQLVQILTTDLPEDREIMMTFAQQLEQRSLQQGEHRKALAIAKNLLKQNIPLSVIKSATGLSEQELNLRRGLIQ